LVAFGLNLTLLLPDSDAINFSFKEEGFLTFASPYMDSFMIDLELVGVVKKSIALISMLL
jgi:hypothetical protein